MTILAQRTAVMLEASSWIGTRFEHGQRLKGVGVDCAQFIAAVFEDTGMIPRDTTLTYSHDWYLHRSDEILISELERRFIQVEAVETGDIMAFRYGRSVAHAAIAIDAETIIHADALSKRVVRTKVSPSLASRFAMAFSVKGWHE